MTPIFSSEPKVKPMSRAPLFHRLCGADTWLDEDQVRQSIADELSRILNARSTNAYWQSCQERGTRVMGWAEILTYDPVRDRHFIEGEIKRRITQLETRLHDVSIELLKLGEDRFSVHVRGVFYVTPQHTPAHFTSSIQYELTR